MPLVIRELVIRARVEAAPGEEDKRAARQRRRRDQDLIAEAVERVLEVLRARGER